MSRFCNSDKSHIYKYLHIFLNRLLPAAYDGVEAADRPRATLVTASGTMAGRWHVSYRGESFRQPPSLPERRRYRPAAAVEFLPACDEHTPYPICENGAPSAWS
jgi:hypothetical protein